MVLVFYRSSCGSCETSLERLKIYYKNLVAKGLKIIALSDVTDKSDFQKIASGFPWTNICCDLGGINGINFKNYAVIGTPTMYLLNSKGTIIQKLATVEELLALTTAN